MAQELGFGTPQGLDEAVLSELGDDSLGAELEAQMRRVNDPALSRTVRQL